MNEAEKLGDNGVSWIRIQFCADLFKRNRKCTGIEELNSVRIDMNARMYCAEMVGMNQHIHERLAQNFELGQILYVKSFTIHLERSVNQ